ncbi:MAG: tetratricopeptide repeat protein, partial [Cyanobacteria bacterium J06643_5]
LNKAVAEMNLENYQDAQKSIDNSIKSGDSFAAYYNQAIILSRLGNYKEAIDSFQKANQFKPDNYLVLTGQGIALMNWGEKLKEDTKKHQEAENKLKKALKFFDRALVLDSSYSLAIKNREILITKMEKPVKLKNSLKINNSAQEIE